MVLVLNQALGYTVNKANFMVKIFRVRLLLSLIFVGQATWLFLVTLITCRRQIFMCLILWVKMPGKVVSHKNFFVYSIYQVSPPGSLPHWTVTANMHWSFKAMSYSWEFSWHAHPSWACIVSMWPSQIKQEKSHFTWFKTVNFVLLLQFWLNLYQVSLQLIYVMAFFWIS